MKKKMYLTSATRRLTAKTIGHRTKNRGK